MFKSEAEIDFLLQAMKVYLMDRYGLNKTVEVDGFKCPECEGEMLLRTNRQDGNKFWGCKQYPKCRGTRDEEGLSRSEREALKQKKENAVQEGGFSFNREKRNPVTEVAPPTNPTTKWINPFDK